MKRNSRVVKAHLTLLGANLFYGAGCTIAKSIMPDPIKPFGVIVIRVGIVTLLFWLTAFGGPKYNTPIQKRDWPVLILGGLFGVALSQMLFFYGLNLTLPIHASLIMMSSPLLITVIAIIMIRSKLTWDKGIGLLVGISGAALLMMAGKELGSSTSSARGDFFVLLNACFYAVYIVIIKPLIKRYRPFVIVRWVFLFGLMFVLPFGLHDFVAIDWHRLTAGNYAALAFLVVCCTFFTYLWNMNALQVLSPSTASAYIYLQPVFAAFISVMFAGESLSLVKVVAAVLIFSGVYLVNFGIPARVKRFLKADKENNPSAFTSNLQAGDEVIVLEHGSNSYIPKLEIRGAKAVPVKLASTSAPDWDRIKAAVTPRTKAIIINTPHTPASVAWTRDDWEALAQLVDDTGIYILSDKVHEQLIQEGASYYREMQPAK